MQYLYANPVSPIADSIIDMDSSNIQMEDTLTSEDVLCSSVFTSIFCLLPILLTPQKINTAGKINIASRIG